MSNRSIDLLLVAVLCTAGCTHLPWQRPPPDYEGPRPPQAYQGGGPADQVGDTNSAATTAADSQAMLEVVDQLQSMGGLTPDERQQLIADLRRTKPSLWPAMVQQFRAALAFRQQLLEREADEAADAKDTGPRLAGLNGPATGPIAGTVRHAVDRSSQPGPGRQEVATPPDMEARRPVRSPASATSPTSVTPASAKAVANSPRSTPAHLAAAAANSQRPHQLPEPVPLELSGHPPLASNRPLPIPTTQTDAPGHHLAETDRDVLSQTDSQTAVASGAVEATGRATATTLAEVGPEDLNDNDWHDDLTRVIRDLEQETDKAPRTGMEVNRHAALRILYLIADRRQDALRPIPGISPTLQDFWTKQLYGLATYLDSSEQPDSARRATLAKQYLSQAASRLGDLGLLTVQNLALCTEVSSFGVFQAFEQREFVPGQEALLYAEVNNFHSEETEKGFRTALRSSYQILDSGGKQVAQREFAVTEDYCKNRRRDFFMRYFIRLPAEIAPGSYTLELTIEDTLANKIGQSSLPLTIKSAVAKRGG